MVVVGCCRRPCDGLRTARSHIHHPRGVPASGRSPLPLTGTPPIGPTRPSLCGCCEVKPPYIPQNSGHQPNSILKPERDRNFRMKLLVENDLDRLQSHPWTPAFANTSLPREHSQRRPSTTGRDSVTPRGANRYGKCYTTLAARTGIRYPSGNYSLHCLPNLETARTLAHQGMP